MATPRPEPPDDESKADEKAEKKASFDSLMRAWAGEFASDLAAFVLGVQPERVRQAETGLAAAASRFTDKLLDCSFPDRPGNLVHLEFQTESSPDGPERMAVYIVLIQPVLRQPEHAGKSFAAAVVYLDEKRFHGDPGCFERVGEWGTRVSVSYRVIKLWEVPPDVIRNSGRPGLLPLLPLMRGNPRDLLVESKERILSLSGLSKEVRNLLVTLTFGLATVRLKQEEIKGILEETPPMAIESPIFEILEEIAQERQSRRYIVRVLNRRFGTVSPDIESRIARIKKLDVLDSLFDEASVAPTLADFERRLASFEG